MEIYQIKMDIVLKREVKYKQSMDFISKNVNRILYNSLLLRSLHESKGFKPYVVGSMGKSEPDKRYVPNKKYTLSIRSIDSGFVQEFERAAKGANRLDFDIKNIDVRRLSFSPVTKLYTITPAVMTLSQNRYWTSEDDIGALIKGVKENLIKKYRHFFKKEITPASDFINYFELHNNKPIVFEYKKGKILANRFTFAFAPDSVSQELAKLAFGVGILEKNPQGFGMVVRGKE